MSEFTPTENYYVGIGYADLRFHLANDDNLSLLKSFIAHREANMLA